MANKIKFKRSYEEGARPKASDLDQGEIAVNANKAQPALFMEVRDDKSTNASAEIIKVGPTAVLPSAPDNPTKGETWLSTPAVTDTNQRFPTLKVYNGSEFVDAIRMVIPENKPTEKSVKDFKLVPTMSGQHVHFTDDTDYTNIVLPDKGADRFVPGQAVSIYNARSKKGGKLYIKTGKSTIHPAGTDPELSLRASQYVLSPGALVTLLCVNKTSLSNTDFGTFVLAGSGIG